MLGRRRALFWPPRLFGEASMAQGSYKQFCPVAMAAEILCTRWTVVLLRELIAGSTRFNDLRRGVPRMSPALLSQRLKELEAANVITRAPLPSEPGIFEYRLTDAGHELEPLVQAFGVWGQRWVDSELSLQHLDVQLLMWDMRRNLDPDPLPKRRKRCPVSVSGAPGRTALVVAVGRSGCRGRSVLDRPRFRCRSLRLDRSADDDRDLDGARHGTQCARQRRHALERRLATR